MFSAYRNRIEIPANPRNPKSISVMFLAVAPLGTTLLSGNMVMGALALALMGMMALALWLITEGQKRQDVYEQAETARAPRLKRKILGSALIGVFVLIVSLVNGSSIVNALLMALTCGGLSVVAFGLDPLRNKGLETVTDVQGHTARRATAAARLKLDAMVVKITALQDDDLSAQAQNFRTSVIRMLNALENDPARLRSLRKYIGLYLDAAGQATDRFAGLYANTPTPRTKLTYMELLCDLSEQFQARTDSYMQSTEDQLALEIGLLRDRLRQDAPA